MFSQKSISHVGSILFVIVFMLSVMPFQTAQAAGVRYAKPAASGSGDCSSWANACSLQTALTGADSGDEIWAAVGTYKPTTDPTDRAATFQLKSGVALYGGFAGTETARDQRNPANSLTILSGDLNGDDNGNVRYDEPTRSDNSYHVVTGVSGATLDGFTITDGNANADSSPDDSGGGMYSSYDSSARLTNVSFTYNSALSEGGGMYNFYHSSPMLTDVTFNRNSADNGGGMYNGISDPTLTNTTFRGNTGGRGGGGMYNDGSNPTLTNVTFSYNTVEFQDGGGMYNYGSSPTLTNVTFDDNWGYSGGGMYNYYYSSPKIRNAILWDSGMTYPEMYNGEGSYPQVIDSVVRGGCPEGSTCTNIIITDPKLGSLGDYGGLTQTVPLLRGSAAIDVGNDTLCPTTDQRGVARPQGAHCDIGAYESEDTVRYTHYVRPAISGSGDCSSWMNACTLQTALTTVFSGEEIWVMAGTYKPTPGTDRATTFQLKSGVPVYGGFAGTETARDQRNPVAHLTLLSGDLNGNDNGNVKYNEPTRSDNSYHVVTGVTGATLDGFTITAGNANASYPDFGGGMYNDDSSPKLTNIIFSGNSAYNGGGMYNGNSSVPKLTDVTFSGNSADYGAGMYNYSSNPWLINVIFSGNSAYNGGGMYNGNSSSPKLTDVTFSGNSATYNGGGMHNYSQSHPTLTNVTFNRNSAGLGDGGGIYNNGSAEYDGSNPSLTNVTFSGNSGGFGGGMYNKYSHVTLTNVTFNDNSASYGGGMYNTLSSPEIRNTILWDNIGIGIGAQIDNSDSFPIVSNSVVQDGCPTRSTCTNIILTNPKLGPLNNYGGLTRTIPLLPGSSAMDVGDDALCPTTDQRGVARPQGAHCDIGAYEADKNTVIDYIYYAKPTVSGTGDCSSWANACLLQTALTSAVYGNEIWVMAGTYKPTTTTDRAVTFQLKNGAPVYGGFAGTETARDQRDPAVHLTILSGDIDHNDSQTPIITNLPTVTGNATNSYHVVTGANGATLDGFTVTAGNANVFPDYGGGMYNIHSRLVLVDINFSGNSATAYGGGMYNELSSPWLINVTFDNNSASWGGGMYNLNNSSPTLINVTFSANSADYDGGGMGNKGDSSPTLMNVTFSTNSAAWGGGMYNDTSDPTLMNVTFSANSATYTGGGMYNEYCGSRLANVTFSGNSAGNTGGGMENNLADKLVIYNTIFWGNTTSGVGAQIHNHVDAGFPIFSSTPILRYSVIQGGCPVGGICTNIITTNPNLGTLGNYGGFTQTVPLLAGSSAIDASDDAACTAADQRGVPRPQGPHCDIGAFEVKIYPIHLPLVRR